MHEIGWTIEKVSEHERLKIRSLSGVTCQLAQGADGSWCGRRRPHPHWDVRLDAMEALLTD